MVSTAQINADESGGGREGFGGVMKPINVGGGNSSGRGDTLTEQTRDGTSASMA
jgi:hypothetical protein